MDHNYIEQFDIVDQYLMGRLTPEESERFEEHFVDCPRCVDRLETTRSFMQGLKLVAAQEASRVEDRVPKGPVWLTPLRPLHGKPLAVAASFLLLVTVAGSVFLINQVRRLRSEVNEAKSASAEWARRYEEEQLSASLSDRKREEAERGFAQQLRLLEDRLAKGEAKGGEPKLRAAAKSSPGAVTWVESGADLPIVPLRSVRGSEPGGSEPANQIALPDSPRGFAITIQLEDDVKYENYRVTIFDNDRVIWKKSDHKPTPHDSLLMIFNSASFRPGKHLLRVEGLTEDGRWVPIGDYPLVITRDAGKRPSP